MAKDRIVRTFGDLLRVTGEAREDMKRSGMTDEQIAALPFSWEYGSDFIHETELCIMNFGDGGRTATDVRLSPKDW